MLKHFSKLILLAILYALVAYSNDIILITMSALVFIWLLFVDRELAYQLLVLMFLQFIDFIDAEEHGRIESVFKFVDLFFVICLIEFLVRHGSSLRLILRTKDRVFRWVLIVIGFICAQALLTSWRSGQPVVESLQMARNYLYLVVILLFGCGFSIDQLQRRQYFLIGLSVVVLGLNLWNYGFGYQGIPPFALYNTWTYGSVEVVKSYLAGVMFIFILFVFQLTRIIVAHKRELVDICLAILFLSGVITVTFRILWFATLVAVAVLFIARVRRVRFGPQMVFVVVGLIIAFLYSEALRNVVATSIWDPITAGYKDIASDNPSLTGRVEADIFRIQAFLSSPILGQGFLHPDYYGLSLGTIDTGYVDLLVNFGILGTILMFALYVVIYRSAEWHTPWGATLKMFVIISFASLPAAALMSDVTYGYLPLSLIFSLAKSQS